MARAAGRFQLTCMRADSEHWDLRTRKLKGKPAQGPHSYAGFVLPSACAAKSLSGLLKQRPYCIAHTAPTCAHDHLAPQS